MLPFKGVFVEVKKSLKRGDSLEMATTLNSHSHDTFLCIRLRQNITQRGDLSDKNIHTHQEVLLSVSMQKTDRLFCLLALFP